MLDKNRDGAINFAEFCDWWKAGEVTYVLKGNDGVAVRAAPRSGKGSTSASSSKPPVPSGSRSVRSRRSTGKREERNAGAGGGAGAGAGAGAGGDTGSVAGFAPGHEGIAATKLYMRGKAVRFTATDLKPNRCYTFFLRHVSARATSELSPPLHVITPPVKPYMPVVVRTKPRAVTLRWFVRRLCTCCIALCCVLTQCVLVVLYSIQRQVPGPGWRLPLCVGELVGGRTAWRHTLACTLPTAPGWWHACTPNDRPCDCRVRGVVSKRSSWPVLTRLSGGKRTRARRH